MFVKLASWVPLRMAYVSQQSFASAHPAYIKVQEHPISGQPAFFVHPCNTAEAIRNMGQSVQINATNYLQAWLGFVGPAVGLHLPLPCSFDKDLCQ